jgi:hypothetical protein
MSRARQPLTVLSAGLLVAACLVLVSLIATWFYTTAQLSIAARRDGVHETPEAGMRALAEKSWVDVEKIEIEYAGPNSFDGSNPHVWFVVARVWAGGRTDGKPMGNHGYGSAGSFFLHTRQGWVHVPEGAFPEFVGFGMRLFGLLPAGEEASGIPGAADPPGALE